MSLTTLSCSFCGKQFEKSSKEYRRRVRLFGENVRVYCSHLCSSNFKIIQKEPETVKCPCGNFFETTTGSNHCSRDCASRFSVNDARRNAPPMENRFSYDISTIVQVANSLRAREYHKYIEIEKYLIEKGIRFQFEFPLTWYDRVFDLCLYDYNIFIEFDERHHKSQRSIEDDIIKDKQATMAGYLVYRIPIDGKCIPFNPMLIDDIISSIIKNSNMGINYGI